MYNKYKNIKGITMIALIITIIILLVLAGISIATLTGENGLLNRTKQAKTETQNSALKENLILSDYENIIGDAITGSTRENNANLLDTIKYLAGESKNENLEAQMNEIVNSESTMNEICSSKNMFTACANQKAIMSKICESSVARTAMYNNYTVTESILASSNIAIQAMKESSKYEIVTATMAKDFNTLYNGKAFVLGNSQDWHSGAVAVTMTHGNYINGESTYTYIAASTNWNETGLGVTINKFVSSVQEKNSYGTNDSAKFYSAIFKID